MPMKRTRALLLGVCALLCTASSHAQFYPAGQTPVTGAPYSIVEETEHTRTLDDGTHIATKSQRRLFRDSYGRTRVEFPGPPEMPSNGPAAISIYDPVAGKRYSLQPQQRLAQLIEPLRKSSPTATTPSLLPTPPPAENLRPKMIREDLGIQTIDGIEAKGTRTTTTIPINAQGNDRPIVVVSETWTATDLGVLVLAKNSDPRMGQTITRLISLDRSEPDPALFQVPPDYVVRQPNSQ
jgi:hypothetical protein